MVEPVISILDCCDFGLRDWAMAARLKQTRRWDYLRCAALMVSATTVMTDSMIRLPRRVRLRQNTSAWLLDEGEE